MRSLSVTKQYSTALRRRSKYVSYTQIAVSIIATGLLVKYPVPLHVVAMDSYHIIKTHHTTHPCPHTLTPTHHCHLHPVSSLRSLLVWYIMSREISFVRTARCLLLFTPIWESWKSEMRSRLRPAEERSKVECWSNTSVGVHYYRRWEVMLLRTTFKVCWTFQH